MANPYIIRFDYDTETFDSIDTVKSNEIKEIIEQGGTILTDIISESHGYRIASYNPDYDMMVNIKISTLGQTTIANSSISSYANNNSISPDFPIKQDITLNLHYINNYFTNDGSFNGSTCKRLLPVIIHEMLHGIGIGTYTQDDIGWGGFLDTNKIWYIGKSGKTRAIEEYRNIIIKRLVDVTNINRIPVENSFGEGTAYSHWEEGKKDSSGDNYTNEYRVFNGVFYPALPNEIMTGFSGNEYFTGLTAGALEDYGYKINWNSQYITSDYPTNLIQQLPPGYVVSTTEDTVVNTKNLSKKTIVGITIASVALTAVVTTGIIIAINNNNKKNRNNK
jgi:hypothetical protein